MHMQTMLDVRNLLKKYGIFIYTRNRVGDADLMELEIRELFANKLITKEEYMQALLILKREKSTHQ